MMFLSTSALIWLAKVFEERFGQRFILSNSDVGVRLSLAEKSNKYIQFTNSWTNFFGSTKRTPFSKWNACREGWQAPIDPNLPAPGAEKLPCPLIRHVCDHIVIEYNIPELCYWSLNRIEEIDSVALDNHGRFPASSSHAYRYGYLERPWVDEWICILGQVIRSLWPDLTLKSQQFHIKVSHDVDIVSQYEFRPFSGIIRSMVGNVIKRGDIRGTLVGPQVWMNSGPRLHAHDPYNSFDWIMDVSEKYRIRSAFYFICGRTDPSKDANYEIEHPRIRDLMRRIHARGHEIGLHPSYGSYQNSEIILAEAKRLQRTMEEERIDQELWGGRMHFLRWKQPETLRACARAGMAYDGTMGFADHPGFRCGTCFEYPAFDPLADELLSIRIRPLVAMECTVMAARYMNLGMGEAAYHKFLQLVHACRLVNGCFTLLWHNSELNTPKARHLYESILEQASATILN